MRWQHVARLFPGFVLGALILAGCSDSGTEASVENDDPQTRIEGTVFDAVNSEPIRDAIVRTDPPSEEVSTDADGGFVLNDNFNGEGTVQVIVEHFAYETTQTNVSVSDGLSTRLDVPLQSSAIGLHTSSSLIGFSAFTSRKSLRLSSNVQNTGYSVLVTEPWISVTPSRGVIANRESAVLQILLDRSVLPQRLPAEAEIVINSDNGTRELVITVIVEDESISDPNSPLHPRQSDCRRSDVLRVGLDDPNSPLIQFLPSVELPGGEGGRNLQIDNPFLIDSIVVSELGVLSIAHVAGGPPETSLELFELDTNNTVQTIAFNRRTSSENLRASLQWAVTNGVYCYYLGGTNENFDQTYQLAIDIDFTPAQ